MLEPQALEQMIRAECVPLRDCMLTVTDHFGEAAFLYFKEGELIEANYSALWGKEALVLITTWNIAEHTVAPLPLGIKRSLWDPLELLLNPGVTPTASGRIPLPLTLRRTRSSPFDRFKAIPGLSMIIQITKEKESIVFDTKREPVEPENLTWLVDFAHRVKSVGVTLGFGASEKWSLDTERYQIVALRQDDGFIALLRPRDGSSDDLDEAVEAVLLGH